ncbi:elongation factor P, partial [Paraprevotella clara]
MINAQDIKKGTCIRMDGKLYFCIDFLHVKPGKGNTFMRTKLKDVVNGYVLERRFNIGEALEDVRVERRPYQYLYQEGEDYIFMNQETFEQIPIAKELINGVDFMKEGEVVDVVSDASTETVLYADVPT